MQPLDSSSITGGRSTAAGITTGAVVVDTRALSIVHRRRGRALDSGNTILGVPYKFFPNIDFVHDDESCTFDMRSNNSITNSLGDTGYRLQTRCFNDSRPNRR